MRSHQGQSTVEYILLVTAVISVIIIFLTGGDSTFRKRLTNVLDVSSNSMTNVAQRLAP